MPYIDPSVLASTIENAQCKAGELSDKYINSVNSGDGCECALAELRMLIFTIKALECCSSQSSCGTTIEETFRMMESTMLDCAAPTCTSSVSSPTFPPLPLPLISSLINVEENGTLVGAFSTLNFIGLGISTVTATNAGQSVADITINTNGLEKTWFAEALSKASAGTLIPDRLYWIVDVGDGEGSNGGFKPECSAAYYNFGAGFQSYAHNAGIMLRAVSATQFDPNGVYLARVPKTSSQWYIPGTNYGGSTSVVSYNQVFTTFLGVTNAQIEPAEDTAQWTYVVRDNNTYYDTEVQGCIFDVSTATSNYGIVRERWDARGNRLTNMNTVTTGNEFIKKSFRWGVPTIAGNTINFWDDSTRRLSADSMRSPSFNDHLINYGNVQQMRDNRIDTDISAQDTTLSFEKRGTRFWNMYWLPTANFQGNKLDNVVISNMTWSSPSINGYQYINNVIENSVINNFNCIEFVGNTIKDESSIGDVFYYNLSGSYSNESLLERLSFTTLPNLAVINNLGSKSWIIAGGATSSIVTSGGGVTVTLASATTGVAINDFVQFVPPSPSNTQGKIYTISAVSAPSSFDITDPTVPLYASTSISCLFHYRSIVTSVKKFNYNIISNSVFRGINKGVIPSNLSTLGEIESNTIEKTFFENYVDHTPANSAFNGKFYNAVGQELTSLFRNNKFFNTVAINNRWAGFLFQDNNFSYCTLSYNNPQTSGGGVTNGGFNSAFFDRNTFEGDKYGQKLGYGGGAGGFYFDGYSSTNISSNNFSGTVSENYIGPRNIIYNCVVQSGGAMGLCNFKGYILGSNIYNKNTSPGLTNVIISAGATLQLVTFDGYQAGLDNLTIVQTNELKQMWPVRDIGNFSVIDQKISGGSKSSTYRQVLPGLTMGSRNGIRGITIVSTTPDTVTIGTTTYNTAKYRIRITSQAPHLITTSQCNGTNSVDIIFRGFSSINVVDGGDLINHPNGIKKKIAAGEPYPWFIGFSCFGILESIVNEYEFECTIYEGGPLYQFSQMYLLPPGDPFGDGLSGSYSDADNDGDGFSVQWWPTSFTGFDYPALDYQRIDPKQTSPTVRISVRNTYNSATLPNTPSGQSRKLYQFKDWNEASPSLSLYDPATKTLRIPHFYDLIGCTVLLGSHGSAPTVEISKISGMPENIPIRFVTSPGTTIQFNLVPASTTPSGDPQIIKDSAATTLTMTSYYNSGSGYQNFTVFDEVVMMLQAGSIKIISKIINV